MKLDILKKNARCVVIKIDDGGHYNTRSDYDIILNGSLLFKTDKSITTILGLLPDTFYIAEIGEEKLEFKTDKEFVTLCVKDFGAKGDGIHDDTLYIQAAIMSCPQKSRVLIPAGDYLVNNLFLISNIKIELQRGARIIMNSERFAHPIMPGMTESYDGLSEYNLGTWEGNPLSMFAACITGINVKNVEIYGEGEIFGNASQDVLWKNQKTKQGAWRPRLFFLESCENISVFGLTFRNSPSWNVHPYFSKNIELLSLNIFNPENSPNTDGIDVESCKNVHISGVHFNLGDDCIALKSCKIYMAKKYRRSSENIHINNCLMESGHGAVTIGSEMAGGVKNVTVKDCFFRYTDRGLRIKTRRGRGNLAIIDNVVIKNITMDNVLTPFAVNSFYFCDPDGRTEYVQTRTSLPVDHRTPRIGSIVFEDIVCENAHIAAAYILGLPEKKIEEVTMRNVRISFAQDAVSGEVEMHGDIPIMSKHGIFAANIERLLLENVTIENHVGPELVTENISEVEKI